MQVYSAILLAQDLESIDDVKFIYRYDGVDYVYDHTNILIPEEILEEM